MSTKIKFNIFNTLFHLFAFLADKTNGWKLFVKPKLLFGSLIMGIGISACSLKDKPSNTPVNNEMLCDDFVVQYDTMLTSTPSDTIISGVMCYAVDELIATDIESSDNIDNIEDDSMKVYKYVEQMPEFPEGVQALLTHISENLHYPDICLENGIQGRVNCRFIVERDGTISDIKVTRNIHPLLDKEAVKVIKSFPSWVPGQQDGRPVRVYFSIPVIFKLQ